jgi:SAM-dependent methyltransferase
MPSPQDSPADLERFYEEGYRRSDADAERLGRWRALGARAKADHVEELCARAGLRPAAVAEVGCGDGSLLAELAARGFAPALAGFDLSGPAIELVRGRGIPGLVRAEAFDGARLPASDGEFDLAILSHVLEHVPDPAALLAECARAAPAVALEVPLEANASARRGEKRRGAAEIGHLRAFDRGAMHAVVAEAGLDLVAELADPLTRPVHTFFATTAAGRARGLAKAAVRRGLFTVAPGAAERSFTVHCAALVRRHEHQL